jgi:4-amino-4-deoxy-L-arabinose transferase-like glycosyltransferase
MLGSHPALNADEAAIGYNAYSLLETGKDEHGNPWPVHFQSFNDYKPGGYFYLALPFVKTMGLNTWSVRIPGTLLGVLSVLVLYLFVKELFKDEALSLLSSLFLAISPWHIHFSRGGWEVNAATFFILLGVYLFIRWTNEKKRLLIVFSAVSLAFSLYTYHAARIVVPLFGLGLKLIYRNDIKKNVKEVLIAAAIGLVVLLPLAKDVLTNNALSRAAGVGLFADPGPLNRINEQRGQHGDFRSLPAVFLHNKAVNYGLAFLGNWAEHYWGEFLFVSGDQIQRNKVPETGVMYLFDIVLVLAGLYFIARKTKGWGPILVWLVVAPTAAALTFQSPHALRAQNLVIPLVIVSAYGLLSLTREFKKYRKLLIPLFGLIIVWNFARYLHMYWVHMAKEYPFSSQYGVEELVDYVEENQDKYQKIVVTTRYDQPYILFLFYMKYSPQEFQVDHNLTARDEFGFSTVNHFGKYYFPDFGTWEEVRSQNTNALIAGTDEEIPDAANIVKTIYFPNGEIAFKIVAN